MILVPLSDNVLQHMTYDHRVRLLNNCTWYNLQITPPPIDHDTWQQFRMQNFGERVDPFCLAVLSCKNNHFHMRAHTLTDTVERSNSPTLNRATLLCSSVGCLLGMRILFSLLLFWIDGICLVVGTSLCMAINPSHPLVTPLIINLHFDPFDTSLELWEKLGCM